MNVFMDELFGIEKRIMSLAEHFVFFKIDIWNNNPAPISGSTNSSWMHHHGIVSSRKLDFVWDVPEHHVIYVPLFPDKYMLAIPMDQIDPVKFSIAHITCLDDMDGIIKHRQNYNNNIQKYRNLIHDYFPQKGFGAHDFVLQLSNLTKPKPPDSPIYSPIDSPTYQPCSPTYQPCSPTYQPDSPPYKKNKMNHVL